MRRLNSYLSARGLALLVEAAVVVVTVRIGLLIAGYAQIERWVRGNKRARRETLSVNFDAPVICRAVRIVSVLVPGATCLTQALAAQALLARRGESAQVCFGVEKNVSPFRAHAWLESAEGQMLIGHVDLSQFARLATVNSSVAA